MASGGLVDLEVTVFLEIWSLTDLFCETATSPILLTSHEFDFSAELSMEGWKCTSFGLGALIAARNKQQAWVERIRDLGTHPGQSPTTGKLIILATLLFLKAQM